MLLSFATKTSLSIIYTGFWIYQLAHDGFLHAFGGRIDAISKIVSFSFICFTLLVNTFLTVYICKLRFLCGLSKAEIELTILGSHKFLLLAYSLFNVFVGVSVCLMVAFNRLDDPQDRVTIHCIVLATLFLVEIHKALMLTGLQNKPYQQILFMALVLAGLIFLGYLDANYKCLTRIFKHQVSSAIVIITQLLYLDFFFSKRRAILRVFLKLVQYIYIVRSIYIYSKVLTKVNLLEVGPVEFAFSIALMLLNLIFICIDIWTVYSFIKDRIQKNRQDTRRRDLKEKMKAYFLRILKQKQQQGKKQDVVNLSDAVLRIGIQRADRSMCTICQEPNLIEDQIAPIIQLNSCLHTFHVQCISEWLSRSPRCPLCNIVCPIKIN